MRNLESHIPRDSDNIALEYSKAVNARTFLTGLKQKLKPKAYSKKRFFTVCRFFYNILKVALSYGCHSIAERAYTRQNYMVGTLNFCPVHSDFAVTAQVIQRFFYALQITCAA